MSTNDPVDAAAHGYGSLTPPDEALAILAMVRELLVRDYAGAMVAIIDETVTVVRDGGAARQGAYAFANAQKAALCGDRLSGRVHSLCADLLWDVAPMGLPEKPLNEEKGLDHELG